MANIGDELLERNLTTDDGYGINPSSHAGSIDTAFQQFNWLTIYVS